MLFPVFYYYKKHSTFVHLCEYICQKIPEKKELGQSPQAS